MKMKKTVSVLLILVMLLGVLASCGGKGDPLDGLNGKDAAKLLLANERLDSNLLKESDGIFVSGAEAFKNLSLLADANMVRYKACLLFSRPLKSCTRLQRALMMIPKILHASMQVLYVQVTNSLQAVKNSIR